MSNEKTAQPDRSPTSPNSPVGDYTTQFCEGFTISSPWTNHRYGYGIEFCWLTWHWYSCRLRIRRALVWTYLVRHRMQQRLCMPCQSQGFAIATVQCYNPSSVPGEAPAVRVKRWAAALLTEACIDGLFSTFNPAEAWNDMKYHESTACPPSPCAKASRTHCQKRAAQAFVLSTFISRHLWGSLECALSTRFRDSASHATSTEAKLAAKMRWTLSFIGWMVPKSPHAKHEQVGTS